MTAVAVYATAPELATWTGDTAPTNAVTLLRSASLLVDRALTNAVYDVDDDGLPTDADVIDALRDATCAQAALWAANSIDPTAGTAGTGARTVKRSKLASGEVEYDSAVQAAARAATLDRLCDDAATILRLAGLPLATPLVGQ